MKATTIDEKLLQRETSNALAGLKVSVEALP